MRNRSPGGVPSLSGFDVYTYLTLRRPWDAWIDEDDLE
jgi:hypothetical protein